MKQVLASCLLGLTSLFAPHLLYAEDKIDLIFTKEWDSAQETYVSESPGRFKRDSIQFQNDRSNRKVFVSGYLREDSRLSANDMDPDDDLRSCIKNRQSLIMKLLPIEGDRNRIRIQFKGTKCVKNIIFKTSATPSSWFDDDWSLSDGYRRHALKVEWEKIIAQLESKDSTLYSVRKNVYTEIVDFSYEGEFIEGNWLEYESGHDVRILVTDQEMREKWSSNMDEPKGAAAARVISHFNLPVPIEVLDSQGQRSVEPKKGATELRGNLNKMTFQKPGVKIREEVGLTIPFLRGDLLDSVLEGIQTSHQTSQNASSERPDHWGRGYRLGG